jgi:hypothetical protein
MKLPTGDFRKKRISSSRFLQGIVRDVRIFHFLLDSYPYLIYHKSVPKNRAEKHPKVAPLRFSKKSLGTVATPSESQKTGGDKGRVRLNAGEGAET